MTPTTKCSATACASLLKLEAMPHHEQWEKDGMVSDEIWLKAGEQGFLCPMIPEEYGGLGTDFRYNCIVNEEIGRSGCTGLGWTLHNDITVPYIVRYGSEEQKKKVSAALYYR